MLVVRSWLPAPVGGVAWYSFHGALTSVYVPLLTLMLGAKVALAPAASVSLSPTFTEYVSASHYPATLPATNVSAGMLRATMRNFYAGTPYDMSVGMAAGGAGSPIRGLPLIASPRH